MVEADRQLIWREGIEVEPDGRVTEEGHSLDRDPDPWNADVLLAAPVIAGPLPDIAIHGEMNPLQEPFLDDLCRLPLPLPEEKGR